MKRGILILLTILILLPTVAASVSVTGPSESKYNIGDNIDISGYVFQDEELTGFLQLTVICDNSSYPRQLIPIKINAGEQKTFTNLGVPDVTVTSSMVGSCYLRAQVLVAGIPVEEDSSSSFTVSKELNGLFDLDKTKIQMGDSFQLSGTVSQIDGEKVTGSAEVYFQNSDAEYLIDLISVYGGTISFTYDSSNTYPGQYNLNLVIRDSYGNEQRFDTVETFEIIDEISVFVDTEEDTVLPGSTLQIFGTVMDIDLNPVDQATVEINLDNEELYSTSLSNGAYSHTLEISQTISSGEHDVTVYVEDTNGNKGSATTKLTVTAVPTVLENDLYNTTYNPLDSFEFTVLMYDQAEEVMDGRLIIEIKDSTGALISEKEVDSGDDLLFEIPQFATPGAWTIKSYIDVEEGGVEVIDQDEIIINEVENIEMWVEGEFLYVRNAGNIRYKDDLQLLVSSSGYDYTITKKKSIGVNETTVINLADEVPTGTYSVTLPTGNKVLEVDGIAIENGTSRYKLTWLYIVLAVLFVGGLSYLVYTKVGGKKKKKKDELGSKPKKKFGKRTETKTMEKKPEKKKSLTFDKKKSVEDFKERVVKDIKETEAKIAKREAIKKQAGQRDSSRGSLATVMGKNTAPKPTSAAKPATPKKEGGNFFSLFD